MSIESRQGPLSEAAVADYRTRGWTIIDSALTADELSVLASASLEVMERPGPEVGREADGTPHVCWGMHLFDERLGALAHHPVLVGAAQQLLGGDFFVHLQLICFRII